MGQNIKAVVAAYLAEHPPEVGVTLSAVKADAEVADAINKKHAVQDLTNLVVKVTGSDLLTTTEAVKIHSLNADNQDLSGLVVKVTNKSLVLDTEISKIHALNADNQDLSNLVVKVTGKGLSTNDYTTAEQTKLSGLVAQVQTDWNAGSGMGQLLNKPALPSARLFANLAAPVVTSGTTEKVLLQLAIPANNAVVGSTYRAWIIGNSSSTGTLIFKVRCGNLGTISDTIDWTAVTSAAQVANARAGFDVLITIRSATTIKAEGVGYAGAVQLPTYIAAPTAPAIAISGIWYINLTVICSSGTFTAQVGNIEEIK